jgi:ABC-type glycerol-3-phosphate transport system permease component
MVSSQMKAEEDDDDIREDPVPVLVQTTSSSSSIEELEHAELSLSPTASTSAAGPLSWLCMLNDVLPSCSAEPTASPSSRELKQQEDFQRAFTNGSLLPYIVNSCIFTSTSRLLSSRSSFLGVYLLSLVRFILLVPFVSCERVCFVDLTLDVQ